MAYTLRLENDIQLTLINFVNSSTVKLLVDGGLERPLSYNLPNGRSVRVFRLAISGATKAAVRATVNEMATLLRTAIWWEEDELLPRTVYLAQAADGETLTRELVHSYTLTAVSRGSINPLQTAHNEVVLDLAITVQTHREEHQKTTLTESLATADYSLGRYSVLSGADNTKNSRMFLDVTSTDVTGYDDIWIGMQQYTGAAPLLHIWKLDYATALGNDTSETTDGAAYSTNVPRTTFTLNESMVYRVTCNVDDMYTASSASQSGGFHPHQGEYVALLRYKVSGTGTVFARIGTAGGAGKSYGYNEPRLLDDSGVWTILNMGVVRFPPMGFRVEATTTNKVQACNLRIDAQRLSGTSQVYWDTITFVPYNNYIAMEDVNLKTGFKLAVRTNEKLDVEAYLMEDQGGGIWFYYAPVTIAEERNFLYPVGYKIDTTYYNRIVIAGHTAGNVATSNLSMSLLQIYQAFEAFNA